MAKIYEKRITNCRACGYINTDYFLEIRDDGTRWHMCQFYCFNPDSPHDFGFGETPPILLIPDIPRRINW
jgi:hypothetical protein